MMLYKLGSYEISDAGCYKCQHHLDRASAEQKCEGTACYSGCKPKPCRGVNGMNLLYLIESTVDFFAGQMSFLVRKIVDKLLHAIEF